MDTSGQIVHKVDSIKFKDSILEHSLNHSDTWAGSIQLCLANVIDLPSVNAQYHFSCYSNFKTNRGIPNSNDVENCQSKRIKVGRKADEEASSAFMKVAEYLENNFHEQKTVAELIEMMASHLVDSDSVPYSYKHMKAKLQHHFKDKLMFVNKSGKVNVVTHRDKASDILHESFKKNTLCDDENESNFRDERNKVLIAAAKIIEDDIRLLDSDKNYFPNVDNISTANSIAFIPESLRVFLSTIITSKDSDLN